MADHDKQERIKSEAQIQLAYSILALPGSASGVPTTEEAELRKKAVAVLMARLSE